MWFEKSLTLCRQLAMDNPSSAQAQRDVSVSFTKLGDVAVQASNLATAQARFKDSLAIDRRLAKDNPSSAQAQRDLVLSLSKLGKVAGNRALVIEALLIARELAQAERLARRDRGMPERVRSILDSLP